MKAVAKPVDLEKKRHKRRVRGGRAARKLYYRTGRGKSATVLKFVFFGGLFLALSARFPVKLYIFWSPLGRKWSPFGMTAL